MMERLYPHHTADKYSIPKIVYYYFENPFICKWQKNIIMHQNRKDEH